MKYGIALDAGTTTVSAGLIDLVSGETIDTVSEINAQRRFGADVISRIELAQKNRTEELFTAINSQTRRIIDQFKERFNIQQIEKLAVSGNTVMLHFFLNIDPSGMGCAPFTPAFLDEKILNGEELSLSVKQVIVLPSISAFVGADVTAGLAVIDIIHTPGPSLLLDIGTNGEMALFNEDKILCCSTAAGPAFEGAEISCGIGGVNGAISEVKLVNGAVSFTTIGNEPPLGLCGSGLIDAVAVMLKLGIIDESGAMVEPAKSFELAPGIALTARDIRQFQLAKSAVLSGINILCKNAGLQTSEIKNIFIAGGFGFFINIPNAVAAGIFPKDCLNSLSVCGNLSLKGAGQCLTNGSFMTECKHIISRCSSIDLAADPSFIDEFAENMLF